MNHPLSRHGRLAASLCAFMAASVLASTAVGPEPPDLRVRAYTAAERSETPALPAQPVMRQSQRTIQIANSPREIHLWDERAPAGSLTHHYAIMELRPGDAAPTILGRERATTYNIGLRYAQFDPLRATPGIDARLLAPASNEVFLVQFWAVPLDEMRAQIEAMGGTIYRFLEDNTHIVRMPTGIADNVRRLNYVRWVGPFHPAYKLDDPILSALVQEFQENGGVAGAREGFGEWFTAGEYSIEMFERGPAAQQRVKAFIEAIGGSVSVLTPDAFRIQAHLSPQQIIRVARLNDVHFIAPWGFGGTDMDLVRQLGGADYVEGLTGISGQGVRAEVFDTEINTTHQEFTLVPPTLHGGINTAGPHGTSVYSVMFARGARPNARGLLPDAERGFFFHHRNSTQFGGTTTRLAIANQVAATSGTISQGVVQTSSVGNFPRTQVYDPISAEMDDVIFQSQLLHTQSQSNEGASGTPQNSRPQAWAKNIVSGGAVNHFGTVARNDDTFLAANCGNGFGGTSTGPAQDGRIKPDLSFFFDCTIAATRGTNNTSYTEFGGTSGATPSVGGYMGLFHQMWHENTWEGSGKLDGTGGGHTVFTDRPSPMLPKAALINTAFRYNWNSGGPNASITRFVQGWGMPNLRTLYDARDKTYYADEPFILRQGQSKTHTINVAANEPTLNVTMTYLDPMGTTSATTHRINDLSLKVTSPTGTVYWGNNGLTTGNFSTAGGSSNTKDTVENVFINNPAAGDWTVEILADTVVQDAHVETAANDVDYALWVTGGTESGSIKTTFRAGNGQDGAMFDITAHENITISGFDIQHMTTTSITIEVYSVAGGFAGHETDPAAWTLMGSQTVTPNDAGAATHVSIGGLSIAAGETFGLYVTETGVSTGFMAYTNGGETWDNGEVAISTGVGKSYPFGGTFNPRSWNGVVYYDISAGPGGQTFLVTERNASTIWEWDPATGSTSVFHSEQSNDADYNQAQGSTHGWLAEHFADYFARFDVGSGSGLNAQYTLGLGGRTHYHYPKHIAVFDNSVVVMSRNDGTIWRYSVDGVEQTSQATGFNTGQGLATDGTDLFVSVWNGSVSQFLQYDTGLNQIGGPFPNPTGMGANNNLVDFAYDAASGHWFGLATVGEGGTGTQTNQVVEFTMGGSVVATYTLPFMADGFGLAGVSQADGSLNLCYDVVDIGGGLFEYTFVCDINPGWVPGMGWRWYIFGDQQSAPSPLTNFLMTSPVPGPWTSLSSSGGFHNGPTFAPVLDYWVPASASETLEWSGTSTARLNPGQLLFSTIAGTLGGAVAADFKVATEGCPNVCPCACDWDPDPACNIFDFLAFQTGFVAGDPCACDYDPDPACNIFDFLAFQTQFVGGCP